MNSIWGKKVVVNNMCDLSSCSQSWDGDGFCQYSFVSHEEGSEDLSDSDEDEYLFGRDKVLKTHELYLERERIQTEQASHYVEQFADLDLQPDTWLQTTRYPVTQNGWITGNGWVSTQITW